MNVYIFQVLQLILSGGLFVVTTAALIRVGKILATIENHSEQIAKLWKAHDDMLDKFIDLLKTRG